MKRPIKLTKTIFIILIISQSPLFSQFPVIAVQNGGEPSFFTVLDEAIENADSGDTLYFPGGTFGVTTPINKELHFVGTGHNPDSASTQSTTRIVGTLNLTHGCDSTSIEGFYMDDIFLGNGSGNNVFLKCSNIEVKRCNVGFVVLGGQYANDTNTVNDVQNVLISECVVRRNLFGRNAQNVIIEKNIFDSRIEGFNSGVIISNNIFMTRPFYENTGLLVNNNIFLYFGNLLSGNTNCTFNNNVFVWDLSESTATNTFNNNVISVAWNTIFESLVSPLFDYENNYHLSPGSPASGIGIGGIDAGIYGPSQPYTNGITKYPYIEEINIPNSTDDSGHLNIQVKVSARDY